MIIGGKTEIINNQEDELFFGTHLYPPRYFGDTHNDSSEVLKEKATDVIRKINIENQEVFVTRSGGLFVRVPEVGLTSEKEIFHAKIAFKEDAAKLFNLIICQLCLYGVNSEPATAIVVYTARYENNKARTITAAFLNDSHINRTTSEQIESLSSFTMGECKESLLDNIAALSQSKYFSSISETLPTLIAGAYYNYSRRHFGEALTVSFIVVEQILDSIWGKYIASFSKKRKERLEDTRAYSASVRVEVLLTAGVIKSDLYELIQAARKVRNDTAHRAKISPEGAEICLQAMKAIIEFICNCKFANPTTYKGGL